MPSGLIWLSAICENGGKLVGLRTPAPAHDPRDRDNTPTDSWDPGKLGSYSQLWEMEAEALGCHCESSTDLC